MTYTFNPVSGEEGTYYVTFAVSDGNNKTEYSITLYVDPPTVNLLATF